MPREKSPIPPEELKLWKRYARSPTDANRNALVLLHRGLVSQIANKLARKMGGSPAADELEADGVFGLMQAINTFQPARGFLFATLACQRIRGAMLDGIRQRDPISRLTRGRAKRIDAAREAAATEAGHHATDDDTAAELGITPDELLRQQLRVSQAPNSLSREVLETESGRVVTVGTLQADRREPPAATRSQQRDLLRLVTQGLSKSERLIIILYYYEGQTMREIGQTLDLAESRISQIHKALLLRIKAALADRAEEFT